MSGSTFTENVALRLLFSSDGKAVRPETMSTTAPSIFTHPTSSTEDVEMSDGTHRIASPHLSDPPSSISSGSLEQMDLDCTPSGEVDSTAEESQAAGDVAGCSVPIPWETDAQMSATSKEKSCVEGPGHSYVDSEQPQEAK